MFTSAEPLEARRAGTATVLGVLTGEKEGLVCRFRIGVNLISRERVDEYPAVRLLALAIGVSMIAGIEE